MQHISTIYARFICRELQLSAVEADRLLCDSSLHYGDISTQPFMPYPDFFNFLRRVQVQHPDESLGLQVGLKLVPAALGELGNAMLCAPSIKDALRLAVAMVRLHAAYFRLDVIKTAQGIKVIFIELADLGSTQKFQTEVMMLLSQNLIEVVTGVNFESGKFIFPYEKSQPPINYAEFFHSPCYFSATHGAIEIPEQYLSLRSPFYDATVWENLQLKLDQQRKQLRDNSQNPYSDHVRRFLSAHPPPLLTVSEAAQSLNITERPLSRHLKAEGSSFSQIRTQLLKEYAEFYLTQSDLTIDAIACQLGYRDFSSFRRAFKLWFACSPSDFRKNHNDNR